MKRIVLALLLGMISTANADNKWTAEPVVLISHTSDLFTGCPFSCDNPGSETTLDYVAAGATIISPRKVFEIDLTHGSKALKCRVRNGGSCKFESGSQVTVRFYPKRAMRNRRAW